MKALRAFVSGRVPKNQIINHEKHKKISGIALVLTCSLATTLKSQDLYVGSISEDNIGEYGLDGSTINPVLISGLNETEGIAISGNDLLVANFSNGTVGEYTTSGATVNASLI